MHMINMYMYVQDLDGSDRYTKRGGKDTSSLVKQHSIKNQRYSHFNGFYFCSNRFWNSRPINRLLSFLIITTGTTSVPFISIEHLESVNENFIAYGDQNTLWSYTRGGRLFLTILINKLEKLTVNDQVVVSTSSYATVYESNLNTLEDTVRLFYALNGVTGIVPNDFYVADDYFWLADESKGFSRVRNNFNAEIISNSGPFTNEAFHLSCNHGKLYIATGSWDLTGTRPSIGMVFLHNMKMIGPYNQITNSNMATNIDTIRILWVTPSIIRMILCLFIWWWTHLGDVIENRYTFYNSSLQTRIGQGSNNVLVTGTAFDNQQNLWVANPYTNSPLSVRTPEGDWKSFIVEIKLLIICVQT